VPDDVTSPRAAARWRSEQITKHGRGEVATDARKVTVKDALDAVLADYAANGHASVRDAEGRASIIRDAIGGTLAADVTTTAVRTLQATWQKEERSAATVNRICDVLRRGLRLLARETPPRLHHVPYIPRLEERSPRGRRITTSDAEALRGALPEYLRDPFTLALLLGTRRGQLSRTRRAYVDLDAGLVTYPRHETKQAEEHAIPLDADALAIVERAMQRAVPWCPFLFHGPLCAPGRAPSKAKGGRRWGCVGDFKKAWATACEAAGVGHRRFHDTRVTFATDARAGGMSEGDAMAVGGWRTRSVFDRYNLGDVEALRERLAASRDRGKVLPLRRAGGKA